jgi:hypothetical protein
MKSLFKISLSALFLTVTGLAMADEIRGGAVIVVPEHPYHRHHRHHRHHEERHDQPRSGVSVGVGIHN